MHGARVACDGGVFAQVHTPGTAQGLAPSWKSCSGDMSFVSLCLPNVGSETPALCATSATENLLLRIARIT